MKSVLALPILLTLFTFAARATPAKECVALFKQLGTKASDGLTVIEDGRTRYLDRIKAPESVRPAEPLGPEVKYLELIKTVQARLRASKNDIPRRDKEKIFELIDDPDLLFGPLLQNLASNLPGKRLALRSYPQKYRGSPTKSLSPDDFHDLAKYLSSVLEKLRWAEAGTNPFWVYIPGLRNPEKSKSGGYESDYVAINSGVVHSLPKLKEILNLGFKTPDHRAYLENLLELALANVSELPDRSTLYFRMPEIVKQQKEPPPQLVKIENKYDRYRPGFLKKGPQYVEPELTPDQSQARETVEQINQIRKHLRRDVLELYSHDVENVVESTPKQTRAGELFFWQQAPPASLMSDIVQWRRSTHEWVLRTADAEPPQVSAPTTRYQPVTPRLKKSLETTPMDSTFRILSNVEIYDSLVASKDLEMVRFVLASLSNEMHFVLVEQKDRIHSANVRILEAKKSPDDLAYTLRSSYADLLQLREDLVGVREQVEQLLWKTNNFDSFFRSAVKRPDLEEDISQDATDFHTLYLKIDSQLNSALKANEKLANEAAKNYKDATRP